ncbi:cobalamin-dependent protein [soil metagenome]
MRPVRTIKLVARETGLSVHAIRVWEKRYGAVTPIRADNNRRLYSEEDVERLRLLHEATLAGHSISQIARASLGELQQLVRDTGSGRTPGKPSRAEATAETATRLIDDAIVAVESFDGRAIVRLLDRGAVELGSPAVLQKFIAPLAERVGSLWRAGDLSVAHEHFVTNHISEFLATFARPYSEDMAAPHLVLATPSGELHELGAVIVAAAARSHGWRTTYLGAALPVEEFAGAVGNLQPLAVGLSIVIPLEGRLLRRDLRKLRQLLPKTCVLLVGGRAAAEYQDVFEEIGAVYVARLEDLYPVLDKLQRGGRGKGKK